MIDHLILQMHKFKDEQKILKKVNSSYQVEKNGQKLNHEEIFSQIKQNLIKKKQFDSKVQESSILTQTTTTSRPASWTSPTSATRSSPATSRSSRSSARTTYLKN
jgi:hypothetical protein